MTHGEILEHMQEKFSVATYPGVAFYFYREELVDTQDTWWDGTQVATGMMLMVMVGDDRKHVVDPEDISLLSEDDYCPECGQIGCKANG